MADKRTVQSTKAKIADILGKLWAVVLFLNLAVTVALCVIDMTLYFKGAAVAAGTVLLIGLILQPVIAWMGAGKAARRLLLAAVLLNLIAVVLYMLAIISIISALT